MKASFFLFLTVLLFSNSSFASDSVRRTPTIDDLLNIKSVGGAEISPDGHRVAYTVTEADFQQDIFAVSVWLADVQSGKTFQLTRGEKSSSNPQWSPNGEWVAFVSDRNGGKNQIFLIAAEGGEAMQLTKSETGINGFAWSPDGKSIAFTAAEPMSKDIKDRKDAFSEYEVVRKEYACLHLWTIDVFQAMKGAMTGLQRTQGKTLSVGGFDWSPDGVKIVFSATINPDLIQAGTADIFTLNLADNSVKAVATQPGPDVNPRWSPDGKRIVFLSAFGNLKFFHVNLRLAVVSVDGEMIRSLSDEFDEIPTLIAWKTDGIYFSASQKTASHLFRINPETTKISRITAPDNCISNGFSFTRDGKRLAFTAFSSSSLNEIFVSEITSFAPRKLTAMTEQTATLRLGLREVISWKSQDGTPIEGILIKPSDFDASKKYPLLCVIHGGPTGIDRPSMTDTRYYPSDIWAGRGALILKVNYRGSAGYGEKFRQLNVRNLGVGDAWDVLSGIDSLIEKGWVDPKKVGCMGWSQGGYISAFLTASTDRFAAISVGAGISNWATYYYNTDITPFTLQYLGDDPVDDPEIYKKTSPISYIKKAKTPTLIQHGENDRRVPIANAYELRQGLEDRGVKVEMVVYKGFGHNISKPKAMRAVMQHNLMWFNHFIFGDALSDLTAPAAPKP